MQLEKVSFWLLPLVGPLSLIFVWNRITQTPVAWFKDISKTLWMFVNIIRESFQVFGSHFLVYHSYSSIRRWCNWHSCLHWGHTAPVSFYVVRVVHSLPILCCFSCFPGMYWLVSTFCTLISFILNKFSKIHYHRHIDKQINIIGLVYKNIHVY